MATVEVEDRGPQLLGVNIAFFLLAAIIVILRCWTRATISKVFGLDDWLMVLSCTLFLGYIICSCEGIKYGTGRHRADLSEEDYHIAKRFWWLCYIFFGLTMLTAKLSFGWLLLRIVCTPAHTYIIYGTSFLVIVAGILFFFITIFQCWPIARYWDDTIPGHCISLYRFVCLGYTYSAVSMLTDFIFALLPAFIIHNLQLGRRIKGVLIILMGLGCLASCAVAVRIAYLRTLFDPDFLWATTDIAIWSTVEMGLAISATSFSTLRPLARHLGWNVASYYHESSTSVRNKRDADRNDSEHLQRSIGSHRSDRVYNNPYDLSKDTLHVYGNECDNSTAGISQPSKSTAKDQSHMWHTSKASASSDHVELHTLGRSTDDGGSTSHKSIKEFIS